MDKQDVDMVSIEEAGIHSLRHYATTTLGLEVNPSVNANGLRGKIATAAPDVDQIPVFIPEGSAPKPKAASPATDGKNLAPGAGPQFASYAHVDDPLHHSNDPRVVLKINKTDDKRRSPEVQVQVNGVTFMYRRGVEVSVPYRVYEALVNAQEKAAIDSDELHPVTGVPLRTWEDVPSYPFQEIELPNSKEVEAWKQRHAGKFQKAPAAVAA